MKIGPYAVAPESLFSLALVVIDAWRLKLRGIPRLPGTSAAAIAAEVLRRNARAVLNAGSGHYWFMWVADFGKAVRGAQRALPLEYLRAQVAGMVRESGRQGRVTSCFDRFHGFDMPYYRGDNLPWLLHAAVEVGGLDDPALRLVLERLLDDYERTHFKDGLIDPAITGDWMDTVLRPSSTYNNICALHMLGCAARLGFETCMRPADLEARILERRWRGDRFTDHEGTEETGVDAGVTALYLGLFPAEVREAIARRFEASALVEPYPIRVAERDYDRRLIQPLARLTAGKYHSLNWLHMGLMYLNGLRRLGRDVAAARARIEALILKHGNVIELVDERGEPYFTPLFACEVGLTMAAAQYLELAS